MAKPKKSTTLLDADSLGLSSPERFEAATGTDDPSLQRIYLSQILSTLGLLGDLSDDDNLVRMRGAVAMLKGIAPKGELEGSLATQMVATHAAALDCLGRAMLPEQTFHGRDLNLKYAQKLLSIYLRQVEVLNKHRGKGQQKVIVEYVNVESGGQAVVGHVESGSTSRKAKRVSKPKAKAISKSSDQPIDLDGKLDASAAKNSLKEGNQS